MLNQFFGLQQFIRQLGKKFPSDVIYLDKVPRERLLSKLKFAKDNLSAQMRDWLTRKQQHVTLNDQDPLWLSVASEVPQSSVLGPIVFFVRVYISDQGVELKTSAPKFADDTI